MTQLPRGNIAEANPFRPDVPDSIRDVSTSLHEYLQEQAEILRKQHNQTQAGDTTFPWEVLTYSESNQRYHLGSLGRFFHPDYGLMLARYVQFAEMSEAVALGSPVGLIAGTDDFKWRVTNQLSKSNEKLVAGLAGPYENPPNDSFGWIIVSGVNLQTVTLDETPVKGAKVGWLASGILGLATQKFATVFAGAEPGGIIVDALSGASSAVPVDLSGINEELARLDSYMVTQFAADGSRLDQVELSLTDQTEQTSRSLQILQQRMSLINPDTIAAGLSEQINLAAQYRNLSETAAANAQDAANQSFTNLTATNSSERTAKIHKDEAGYFAESATEMNNSATLARNDSQVAATAAATSASNAAVSETNAGTSATASQTSATNAATSAAAANTSAGNASTSAGQASTSATNAAGSASTASSQATTATNAATSASTSAGQAATSSSNALTYSNNAATSASNASGSAATATTQAGLSATARTGAEGARDTALNVAANRFPSDFNEGITHWTAGYAQSPIGLRTPGIASSGSPVTFPTVAGIGKVAQIDGQGILSHRGLMPLVAGHTYELRMKFRRVNGAARNVYLGLSMFSGDTLLITNQYQVIQSVTVADGWVILSARFTGNTVIAAYPTATQLDSMAFCPLSGAPGELSQVAFYEFNDVTQLVAAEAQATIATTQATSATGSAAQALVNSNIAARIGQKAINLNPAFSDWPAAAPAMPANWDGWSGAGTLLKSAGPGGIGYSFDQELVASASGGAITINTSITPGLYVIECEFTLVSGALTQAGLYVVFYNAAGGVLTEPRIQFSVDPDASGVVNGAGIVGETYRYSKVIKAGPTASRGDLYIMTGWNGGFTGGVSAAKRLKWNYATIRPASQAEASVVNSAGAVVDSLGQRAMAYNEQTTSANGASTAIRMKSETAPGVFTSDIEMIAAKVTLRSNADGVERKSLEMVGTTANFYGDVNVGGAVRIGARRIAIALQSFMINCSDGEAVSFGADLVNIPTLQFNTDGLVPKTSGQTYDVKANSLTSSGFTMYAKVVTPGTIASVTQGPGTNVGGTPSHRLHKASANDASDGIYNFSVVMSLIFAGEPGYYEAYGEYDVYVFPSGGAWTKIGTIGDFFYHGSAGTATKTLAGSVYYTGAIGQHGDYEFGIIATSGTISTFTSVVYLGTSTPSGVSSATPSGQKVIVTVIPKNV